MVLADIESAALRAAGGGDRRADAGGPHRLADAAAVEELAASAYDRFGAVHVVCNNAGVGTMGPVHKVPLEDWQFVNACLHAVR